MKVLKIRVRSELPKHFTGIAEYVHGTTQWLLNGKIHRIDGPAMISLHDNPTGSGIAEGWCFDAAWHRIDGPAVILFNGRKEYWIHGKQIEDETAYWLLVNMMKLKGIT